ncbi:MAG: flagellar biosynthesis anti-sigma factor FlgM [Methylococcales bacterium]|nr:flagellar biosynthesis anti-sigma factor FlgM [Methylococcales bacterium]MDD5753552.1 flagellar biosynthesis anti-sigma factor FlgM [Methylococcales bacterium]
MAIELIKNGGTISATFKNTPKNSTNNESSDFTPVLSETKTTVKSDSVLITNTVMEIKKSFESSARSGVDVERLARIKQAIEDGTYEINPDRIAAKMIQFGY